MKSQTIALKSAKVRSQGEMPERASEQVFHPWVLEREAAEEQWSSVEADSTVPDLRVGFILWPDFTMFALAGFIDSLRLAADVGDRSHQVHCRWAVMSPNALPLRASCGLEILPEALLKDPRTFDYIVVVGGLMRSFSLVNPELKAYLRSAARAGVPMVGICTGGIALAECGLMANRPCCVTSYHHNDLVARAPDAIAVSDRLFIDDGDRITCAGGAASIDLANYLIERHCGKHLAIKLVQAMLLDEVRAPSSAQRRTGIDYRKVADARLAQALQILEQHCSEPLSMAAVANRVNMSQRQLERLFVSTFARSPSSFHRLIRVQHARWLLEHSQLSLTTIAFQCGFSDTSHFIRRFMSETGDTPGHFRRRLQQDRERKGLPIK